MNIEQRLAALEKRFAQETENRRALTAQFLALQLTLGRVLPIISAPALQEIHAALTDAYDRAREGLSQLGTLSPEDVDEVLSEMEELHGALTESPDFLPPKP